MNRRREGSYLAGVQSVEHQTCSLDPQTAGPSSRPVLAVVRHENIVSPIGGVRKGNTFPWACVQQAASVQAKLAELPFDKRIKRLRKILGLTSQEKAAESWGVSRRTVSNWESGLTEPLVSWNQIERRALLNHFRDTEQATGTEG